MQAIPQGLPVGLPIGPEVDRIDVLVLLRRVLGVGDRAVGTVVEPLGMLVHPGVVGRALQGVVEGHLHAVFGQDARPGGRKSSMVPRSGSMAVWPPAADRWPTGCPGRQVRRPACCCGPCGRVRADRMDRREVQHVEAHGGQRRDPLGRPVEAAERPGEQLVPGPDQRPLAIDPERDAARCRSGRARPVGPHSGRGHAVGLVRGGQAGWPRAASYRSRAASAVADGRVAAVALGEQGPPPRRSRRRRSWPAASLTSTLWAQVAWRSVHASTTIHRRSETVRLARHGQAPTPASLTVRRSGATASGALFGAGVHEQQAREPPGCRGRP